MKKLLVAALFVLASTVPSLAASRVRISECGVLGATNMGGVPAQVCAVPFLAHNTLDVTSGSQSVTTTAQTRLVRVCTEVQINFRGATGVTNNADAVLFASNCEYFGVQPSSVVSVIAAP